MSYYPQTEAQGPYPEGPVEVTSEDLGLGLEALKGELQQKMDAQATDLKRQVESIRQELQEQIDLYMGNVTFAKELGSTYSPSHKQQTLVRKEGTVALEHPRPRKRMCQPTITTRPCGKCGAGS